MKGLASCEQPCGSDLPGPPASGLVRLWRDLGIPIGKATEPSPSKTGSRRREGEHRRDLPRGQARQRWDRGATIPDRYQTRPPRNPRVLAPELEHVGRADHLIGLQQIARVAKYDVTSWDDAPVIPLPRAGCPWDGRERRRAGDAPEHKVFLPPAANRPAPDHHPPSHSSQSLRKKQRLDMHTKSVLAALLAPAAVSAGLNDLAVRAGLKYFGTALRESAISSDSTYASILSDKSEFGQLVPENGQKWDATEATRGTFTYTSGDITASTAKKNGQGLRCHTMVWYSQLPSWVSHPLPSGARCNLPAPC